MRRDLVRNAASEKQVRRAERTLREREEWFGEALINTLSTVLGRRCLFFILEEAGVYRSVWHDHGQRMAFNVGQQDFGHWLLAMCLETSEELTQTMEREARDWKRRTDKPRVEDAVEGETDEA